MFLRALKYACFAPLAGIQANILRDPIERNDFKSEPVSWIIVLGYYYMALTGLSKLTRVLPIHSAHLTPITASNLFLMIHAMARPHFGTSAGAIQ
jgi:hypothetical protein